MLVQLLENLWLRLSPVMVQTHARQMPDPSLCYDNAGHYERYLTFLAALEAGSMAQIAEVMHELGSALLQWFSVHYRFRDEETDTDVRNTRP